MDIHAEIARLARTVHGAVNRDIAPARVLDEVTRSAVDVLQPVDYAAVTLVRKRHRESPAELESTAATSPTAQLFDTLQHDLHDGPCFEAIWQERTVRIDDMAAERRWPRLTAATLERTPIRSTLSIQLYIQQRELGALNLHSRTAHAFDEDTEDVATVLATHAAIALSTARRGEEFRSALASRDIIGQAKGMIMERYKVDAVRAFDMLRQLSQESNTPVADIAARLVQIERPTLADSADAVD